MNRITKIVIISTTSAASAALIGTVSYLAGYRRATNQMLTKSSAELNNLRTAANTKRPQPNAEA